MIVKKIEKQKKVFTNCPLIAAAIASEVLIGNDNNVSLFPVNPYENMACD